MLVAPRVLVLCAVLVPACGSVTSKDTGDGGESSIDGGTTTDAPVIDPCGNGALDDGETCDDGNRDSRDGCSDACQSEGGWSCGDSEPSQCVAPDLTVEVNGLDAANVWNIDFTVHNIGALPVANARIDLFVVDESLDTGASGFRNPPVMGSIGSRFTVPVTLAANSTERYSAFTTLLANETGRYVAAYAVVDSLAQVPEMDDNNNVSTPFIFGWLDPGVTWASQGSPANAPKAIPDMGMVQFPITVNGDFAEAPDYVTVNITHPAVDELAVDLINPDGASIALTINNGAGANFRSTTFSSVNRPLDTGFAPHVGEFGARDPFATATLPNGVYTLRVRDTVAGNQGRVNYWSLAFNEKVE